MQKKEKLNDFQSNQLLIDEQKKNKEEKPLFETSPKELSTGQENELIESPKNCFVVEETKEQIGNHLIEILNILSLDNNHDIAIKLANIIEKLVERFTEPIRLYKLLINILQSQNFDVIASIIRSFFNIFLSMVSPSNVPEVLYNLVFNFF